MQGTFADPSAPSVTVVSPNGGENWKVGETKQIRWTVSSDVGVREIRILLSQDNGITWSTVADNLGAHGESHPRTSSSGTSHGSYEWRVPDVTSTHCLIRIDAYDTSENRGADMSDRAFAIARVPDTTSPTVRVISPNGGESWRSLETKTILWEATDPLNAWETADSTDRIKIDIVFSYDGGRTWRYQQVTNLENTGSHRLQIVHYPSLTYPLIDCLVKVETVDLAGNRGTDTSDAAFTIAAGDTTPPTVRVTVPNGGEIWKVGERRAVNWNASDNVAVTRVDISLHTGAASYTSIASGLTNTGSHSFVVPDTPSRNCSIAITVWDAAGNTTADRSDGSFTIEALASDTRPPSLTIISPAPESVVEGGAEGFELKVRATDDVGIRDFTIKVDGVVRDTVAARPGTDITQILHPRVYGTKRQVITVIATDPSGKTAEKFMGIYSDDAPPKISNVWPPPATGADPHRESLRTSQSIVAIRADIEDEGRAGVKEARLLDSRGRMMAQQTRPHSGNTYIFDVRRTPGDRVTECYIKAFDNLGHHSASNMINIVWEERPMEIKKEPLVPKQSPIKKPVR